MRFAVMAATVTARPTVPGGPVSRAIALWAGRRSGQHLLLTWRLNGWIDHGRLRPLAPRSRVGGVRALADAW